MDKVKLVKGNAVKFVDNKDRILELLKDGWISESDKPETVEIVEQQRPTRSRRGK